jgi:hypothetical protein
MNQQINSVVDFFISNGCRHMTNIPGNQVFLTDVSASTLVWHEGPVVIELYFMYPNLITGLHSHPFDNQVIYLHGQMYGHRRDPDTGGIIEGELFEKLGGAPTTGAVVAAGVEHGFRAGPRGAVVYNVQIWPESVRDPLSAALNFLGPTLGPIHDRTVETYLSSGLDTGSK